MKEKIPIDYFKGHVVLYGEPNDSATSPTYEFTTSKSVSCSTKLDIPGLSQYRNIPEDLNAMTILSNNGITGVSKIVEIRAISSESLLSPDAWTMAGISMTGENTFKINANASKSTDVTVTYKIRYQK